MNPKPNESEKGKMKKVLVTDHISEEGIKKLREFAEVDVELELSNEELKERIAGYDALVIRSGTKVTKEIIEAGSKDNGKGEGKLKVIGRAGVGVDNIDVETATEKGIMVVNAPAANTISAAEHTIAMLLGLSRKIPAANVSLKSGVWERKKHMGVEVNGKVLGIIGLGRVGSEVVKKAKGLGMRVVAYDPFISQDRAGELGITLSNFKEVLSLADFVSLHTPLTKETHHMVGAKEFELMKNGVRVINCARGGLIDERALKDAIKSGKVAGAALDVFEEEPPSSGERELLEGEIGAGGAGTGIAGNTRLITVAMLKSFLSWFIDGVNYVNAETIAKKTGIKVTESKTESIENFSSLISITTTTQSEKKRTVAGTLFGKGDLRIVRLDGFRVDASPSGYMLICSFSDKPRVIGPVCTILGDGGINIAGMQVGREKAGGEAVMVLNVDGSVSGDIMEEIKGVENIFDVKLVRL